ncbi:MAG: pyrroloquinoline quinone-dependent dehydrogenase [Myxococcota bacterium]|nr:pyrroloquinoline quinone-dependent dehydrogenase [Myxococcota bacterium]
MARRLWIAVAIGVGLFGCDRAPDPVGGPSADWPEYGGNDQASRYSPLDEIAPANVGQLEVAWTYRHGDFSDGTTGPLPTSFQNTPIAIDGTLFFCTPYNRVIALDAETGAERWTYDPGVDTSGMYITACRGVSSWVDSRAAEGAACRHRIFSGTLDARILALDAKTGAPCAVFGEGGAIDLRGGVGDVQPGEYGVTSPPTIVGDRVITGAMVLDNRRTDMPGGVVRAFDARTGNELWAWDPVPEGAPPPGPGQRFRRGTTNAWTAFSADAELGLVYVPTGNMSADYYGGHRQGLDIYSSSVVALDVNSGRVAWSFQTVHHDVWDYDVPAQPVLLDFQRGGETVPALVQATKMGLLFFLDRRNGEPIFGVEERPVPQEGAVAGESLSPTQPFPIKPPPIHPQRLDPEDAFGFTPWDRAACRRKIASLRSDGLYTPPSLQGTIQYPGYIGGSNWGSVSIDPVRGILIANTSRAPGVVQLIPREEFEARFPDGPPPLGFEEQGGTPYGVARSPLLSPLGAPCNPPPWGTLVAVDIASGEIRWDVPFGTSEGMAPFPVWMLTPDGVPNLGGPVTTASGLTFIGAATDPYLRAFETATGEELWRGRLPTAAQATPLTYRTRSGGRQFVVVAAGGHGLLGVPVGDSVVAFALPEDR